MVFVNEPTLRDKVLSAMPVKKVRKAVKRTAEVEGA